MNPHDYRRRLGAARRRTDAPAAQGRDNVVRDPFASHIDRLTRDLHLRQQLGSRAHSILTERIHESLLALARARRAGCEVSIPDARVSRVVDAVAAKITTQIEDPDKEPVPKWADLDDTTPKDDPAYEVVKEPAQ